jgi:hypothetical protein
MKNHFRLVLLSALTIVALTLAAWGQAAPGTGGPLPGAPAAPAAGALGAPPLGAVQPPAAPAPEPASLDDAWGVACIGDISGFVDGLGQLTGQFQPMMNAMMIKGLLGGQVFQDPTFEGLPAGSGVAVVFFAPMRYVTFLEVAPAKTDAYVTALQAAGQQPGSPVGGVLRFVDKADGLVVGGSSQGDLAIAKKFAAEVKKRYLDGPGKPTLNVTVFPQKGLPLVEPQILPLLQMASAMKKTQQNQQGANVGVAPEATPAGGMTPERIGEAEARVALSLAHQTNTLDLTFAPAGGGVRWEAAAAVKPDSNLGKFLATAPPKSTNVLALLPAHGAVRGALAFDPNAMTVLVKSESDALTTQMALTPDEKDALQKYQDMQSGMQASAAAFDFVVPGGPLASGSAIYEVVDPVKAIASFKDAPQKMQGLMKMNEAMGMKMTMNFQENARQVKGVPVHRFNMTMQMDPAKMRLQAGQDDLLKKMFGDGFNYDVATVDKLLLLAVGGQSMDDLIGAAQAKSNGASRPLTALTVFGTSGTGYGDLDVGMLAKVLVAVFAQDAAGQNAMGMKPADIADGLQGAAPVTVAGFWGQGPQTRFALDIPADLVAKAAALYAKQQASRAGGAGGQGLGAPGAPGAPQPPRPQF